MIRKIWIDANRTLMNQSRPIAWSYQEGMRFQGPMFPAPVAVTEDSIPHSCDSCGCDRFLVYRHVDEGREDFNGFFDIICDLCKSETIARNINRVTEGPVGECC